MGSLPIDNVNLASNDLLNSIYTSYTVAPKLVSDKLNELKTQETQRIDQINTNADNLKAVGSAQNTMYTISTLENQRLNAKKQNIDQALQGQNRMIALNDSYVKKYAKYNQIIMVFVLIVLVILGAITLPSYVPIVPSFVWDLIIVFAVGVGGLYIYFLYAAIQARDALYFDKLNIPAPTVKDLSDNALDMSLNSMQLSALSGTCIGQDCCIDPSKFINSLGKCMNPPSAIYDYVQGDYKPGWSFDSDNNQWVNLNLNSYWDVNNNAVLSIVPNPSGNAEAVQGFTTMQFSAAEPMQSSETSEYSFYR